MIRLSLGFIPRKVAVRLGKASLRMGVPRHGRPAVSCIWDARLKQRPRQLKLTTRTTDLIRSRTSEYHGRQLHT